MRVLFRVGAAALLAALLSTSALAVTEAEYVAAGKRVSVRRLDPALRNIPLERWLKRVLGRTAQLAWETNDCGEATGSPADSSRDLPVCVEATGRVRDLTVSVSVALGSLEKGISGEPELWQAWIVQGDSTESCGSLSALARSLERRHPEH